MAGSRQHIVVIGAGILGASIAYHLARRGARVTLLDRGPPAGEATGASFAWINASFRNPKPYYDLRMVGLQEYRRLEAELAGRLVVTWGGGLNWDLEESRDRSPGPATCGLGLRPAHRRPRRDPVPGAQAGSAA